MRGHEITHVLEGTELYSELQQMITEYAKSKGDYLFTDEEFINNLSAEKPNIFKKIYNEIKYLCKVATAGSKEARELEKVKRMFDKVYKQSIDTSKNEIKYDIGYTKENRAVAVIKRDIFDGKFDELSNSERIRITKEELKKFKEGIPISGRLIKVSGKSRGHFTNSDYTDILSKANTEMYADKLNISQSIDEVMYASTDYVNEELNHPRNDDIEEFSRGVVLLDIAGKKYEASVLVGYSKINGMIFYDVQDLTPTNFEYKEKRFSQNGLDESDTQKTTKSLSKLSISQFEQNVSDDINFSLTSDSNGKQLSKQQIEYFKDSKVVDDNGNLLVVYHGTRKADFTVFKRNQNYFTDSKEMANSYAPIGEMYSGYLNITKPFVIDAQGEKWSRIPVDKEMKALIEQYGGSVFKEDGKWRTSTADIVMLVEDIVDEGDGDYDGVIIKNVEDTGSYGDGDSLITSNDYIAFNSNKFKNIDNTTPTPDADIRYSLTSSLNISAAEYWSAPDEYRYAYDYPDKYIVTKALGR